jgi:hypothetical protein
VTSGAVVLVSAVVVKEEIEFRTRVDIARLAWNRLVPIEPSQLFFGSGKTGFLLYNKLWQNFFFLS